MVCVCVCVCVEWGFRTYFHKSKLCIVWNWFIAKKIFLRLFKIVGNQTVLEQRSVIKFWMAKCKPCEIYRICNVYRKAFFSKKEKIFTNRLNLDLLRWARTETHSPIKKMFQVQQSVKKVMLTIFRGIKRSHHYWFPWKKYNCKQNFLLPTKAKFTLFIE